MERPPKYLSEFGPFRLDPVNRLLTRDGEIVPLKPKVFDTLLVLVRHAGQVLGKAELMEWIWPDTNVEENNLTQNISALRKILGKDPGGQDYIKTIPRRGYCFTASVQEVWEENADFILEKSSRSRIVVEEEQDAPFEQGLGADTSIRAAVSSDTAATEPRRLRRVSSHTLTAVASFVLGAILAAAVWKFLPQAGNNEDQDFPAYLPTVYIANWKSAPRETGTRNGAFSPGGKMIVFSSTRDEHCGIWIKYVADGKSVEVIGDYWIKESPIWSPGEDRIAFVSNRGGLPGIWSIPTLGGTPTLLTSLQSGWPELKRWSKTSTIYYELDGNLFALDLASKQTTQVTHFDLANQSPSTFSLSPEEDRIVYADGKNGRRDIWVMPLAGGEPTRVTDDEADDRRPVWRPGGEGIVYSSNRNGIYQICMAYLNGRKPTQITNKDDDNYVSDISPDGSKILFVESRDEADLYRVDAGTGEEVEITSDLGLELWPDVSKDGTAIAFQAMSSRVKMVNSSILSRPIEGLGGQIKLDANGFDPRWSPDGSKLGFLRFENDMFTIWVVRAAGGDPRRLTTGNMFLGGISGLPYDRMQTRDYSWSPDGRRIAYCSNKSGRANVWTVDVDTLDDKMISDNTDSGVEFFSPTWSPDGKRIAYIVRSVAHAADGKRSQSVRVTGPGRPEVLFNSDTTLRLIGWSGTGHDIFAAADRDIAGGYPTVAQIDLFQISTGGGGYRQVASISSAYLNSIQLSPDGRSVAFVARQGERDNIWVVPAGGGVAGKITKNTDSRVYFSALAWSPDGSAIYCSKLSSRSFISMIDNSRRKDLVSWQSPPNHAGE
jgi:Tol biopolymer transport system component/DNA-binding winged helix-turn-helix (wHTH) protein